MNQFNVGDLVYYTDPDTKKVYLGMIDDANDEPDLYIVKLGGTDSCPDPNFIRASVSLRWGTFEQYCFFHKITTRQNITPRTIEKPESAPIKNFRHIINLVRAYLLTGVDLIKIKW